MASEPIRVEERINFGDDFELEVSARRLRRRGHALKMERIPLEILVLLLEHQGEIVTRDEIVARVWGKGAFLDTDNSIRGAIRKIRQVLKDDTEYPQFIQTVTGQGYRFIARLRAEEEEKVSKADAPLVAEADHPPNRISRLRTWLVVAGVAIIALLTVTVLRSRSHSATPRIRSLAVLPLKNLSGDQSQEYLADGMTEALIGRLSAIHDLRVISRTSAMRFKETKLSAPEIAKTLGVDALVEGSLIREGTRIRVTAQLIRGATDDHFWSETYDREFVDTLRLEGDVAQSIAQRVEVTVSGEERARVTASRRVLPEAYESYLKGSGKFNSGTTAGDKSSIAYYEDAISKDPTFAPAYVGLAEAYDRMGSVLVGAPPGEVRPKIIDAARKALELDPGLARAHVLLAVTQQRDWQWAEAEAEFRRALELDPNNALAYRGLAFWLLCHGRTEEALDWSRRSRELDPLGVPAAGHGRILFHARRYDEAIRVYRSVLAVDPDHAPANMFLGMALIASGQPGKAIPPLEKVVSRADRTIDAFGVLVMAYAQSGRRADALRLLGELKKRQQTGYVPTGAFVNAYLGLGDYEQTFVWLDRAVQERANVLEYVKVHPFFDPLKGDPRFKELVHRVGLD
jgi:TolB-like protein/DNA-binding winged helix-turn-helix (wHTH) protein/Tfp pilus assembly protein PilF